MHGLTNLICLQVSGVVALHHVVCADSVKIDSYNTHNSINFIGSLISANVVIDRTTSTYFMQLQSEYSTTGFTAVSTSYINSTSVPTVNVASTLVSHTIMASVIATTISTTSPTTLQAEDNKIVNVVIAASVALVIIIIIIMVTLIIIFTWWRRSYKNTHLLQLYPAVSTGDEIVELQQNVCYMTTKGDKWQEYIVNNALNIIFCV